MIQVFYLCGIGFTKAQWNPINLYKSENQGGFVMKSIKPVIIIIVTAAITLAGLWFTNRTIPPRDVDWDDIVAESEKGGYHLIRTDELWERYRQNPANILIVDTRQEWEYRTGHIKGALNFPMEPTWLSRHRKKGALETFLGADKSRLIVFY